MSAKSGRILRETNIKKFGGKCELCGSTYRLNFAHLMPTKLSGRGRGSQERAMDVRDHPENYALLCEKHHKSFDSNTLLLNLSKP